MDWASAGRGDSNHIGGSKAEGRKLSVQTGTEVTSGWGPLCNSPARFPLQTSLRPPWVFGEVGSLTVITFSCCWCLTFFRLHFPFSSLVWISASQFTFQRINNQSLPLTCCDNKGGYRCLERTGDIYHHFYQGARDRILFRKKKGHAHLLLHCRCQYLETFACSVWNLWGLRLFLIQTWTLTLTLHLFLLAQATLLLYLD